MKRKQCLLCLMFAISWTWTCCLPLSIPPTLRPPPPCLGLCLSLDKINRGTSQIQDCNCFIRNENEDGIIHPDWLLWWEKFYVNYHYKKKIAIICLLLSKSFANILIIIILIIFNQTQKTDFQLKLLTSK